MGSDYEHRSGDLSLKISDRVKLHRHYMPFVNKGALFVPTRTVFQLGDNVHLVLSAYLLTEQEPITGEVVWVACCDFGSARRPGVGVRFSRQQANLKRKIEQELVDMLWSDYPTLTM